MGVLKEFWQEEDAVGVVEIILILVGILTTYYGVSIRCMPEKKKKSSVC